MATIRRGYNAIMPTIPPSDNIEKRTRRKYAVGRDLKTSFRMTQETADALERLQAELQASIADVLELAISDLAAKRLK